MNGLRMIGGNMKIRVIKPYTRPIKFGKTHSAYDHDDTVEIDLDELAKWMRDNFIDPVNIDEEQQIINIVEEFLQFKCLGLY